MDQTLEAHRRRLVYRFVMVLAASGLRPHEAAGSADRSLRLRDIEDPGYSVESKQLSRRERPVVFLNVRNNTKTGRRTVAAVCGDVIEKIQEDLCVDQSPDAPLFHRTWTEGRFNCSPSGSTSTRCADEWRCVTGLLTSMS